MISRLRKIAEDSCNVAPNGVIWNDDIWDTYDEQATKEVKDSNVPHKEWDFEEIQENPEWSLQE